MKKFKYRFDIAYQTKYLRQISDFLRKCDLGGDGFCFREIYEMVCNKDNDVNILKEVIKQAYENAECNILQIEGGKWE